MSAFGEKPPLMCATAKLWAKWRLLAHLDHWAATPIVERMSIPSDIERQFFAGVRSDTVRFVINDSVTFRDANNNQRTGSIISIHSLNPQVTYVVEPGDQPWGDILVSQYDLKLLD